MGSIQTSCEDNKAIIKTTKIHIQDWVNPNGNSKQTEVGGLMSFSLGLASWVCHGREEQLSIFHFQFQKMK